VLLSSVRREGSISQVEAASSIGGDGATCMESTSVATTHLSSVDSSSCNVKKTPIVREKLRFPLKFDKQIFRLDFASVGGSVTSDGEANSLKKSRKRQRPSQAIKKKFSSAEKVNRRPIGKELTHSSGLEKLNCRA